MPAFTQAVLTAASLCLMLMAVPMWVSAALSLRGVRDAWATAQALGDLLRLFCRSPAAVSGAILARVRRGRGALHQCTAIAERRWQQSRALAWGLRTNPLAYMQLATATALRVTAGEPTYLGAVAHAQSFNMVMAATVGWATFARRCALIILRVLVVYYKAKGAAAQAAVQLWQLMASTVARVVELCSPAVACVAALVWRVRRSAAAVSNTMQAMRKFARWQRTRFAVTVANWRHPVPPPCNPYARRTARTQPAPQPAAPARQWVPSAVAPAFSARESMVVVAVVTAWSVGAAVQPETSAQTQLAICAALIALLLGTLLAMALEVSTDSAPREPARAAEPAAVEADSPAKAMPADEEEGIELHPDDDSSDEGAEGLEEPGEAAMPQLHVRTRKAKTWEAAACEILDGWTARLQALSPRIEAYAGGTVA